MAKIPDPLKPGHINGQHPATPERMPGHTRYHAGQQAPQQDNEEELGGRPAFLYRSGDWAAVTLDSGGQNLPHRHDKWVLDQYFTLGVRNVLPIEITPEQVIRGLKADGVFVWRTNDPARNPGTSQ